MYLKVDLETYDLKQLNCKFDTIIIGIGLNKNSGWILMNIFPEPPLEEYSRQYGVTNVKFWDWDKIMALDIGESFEVLDGSIFQEVLLYNK